MSKRAFFMESTLPVFAYATCDKCGEKIKDVGDGKCYWNPNRKAIDRNICHKCFDIWASRRDERMKKWLTGNKCDWHCSVSDDGRGYETSCGKYFWAGDAQEQDDYRYCPFCGMPIVKDVYDLVKEESKAEGA